MATKISRRGLFRLRPNEILSLINEKERPEESEGQARRYIRPPGAMAEEEAFLSACTRCNKCIEACPHGVISRLTAVAGRAEGTPYLQPEKDPCRWCVDMPCINACESGALRFAPDGTVPPIAKAVLTLDKCLNEQGILCDTCTRHCPTQVRAIRMVGRNVKLDTDQCTGCGLCAYHCEAVPSALSILFTAQPAS
jgi:ferredoxin-type protein NapG